MATQSAAGDRPAALCTTSLRLSVSQERAVVRALTFLTRQVAERFPAHGPYVDSRNSRMAR